MRTICSAQYCKGNVPAISAKSCGFRKQAPKILPPPAFRDYLLGRFYWNKRNEEGLLKSVEFFNRAIARDPQYARAYSGLADAYLVLGGGYLPDLETYDKARTAALKAIDLDNSLAEAYASLAYEKFANEHDWAGADEDYQKSISLDPEYSTARARYALFLIAMSRPNEAIKEIDRALELDPLSLPITYNAGWIYFQTGRYEEGVTLSKKALEIDPNNAPAHGGLAADYLSMGQYDRAIEEFRAAQKLRGGYSPYAIEVAHVYAVEGRRSEARHALARLLSEPKWGSVAPYSFAVTYAALGQKDDAFTWLQKSVDDHSCTVIEISTDRALDPLRSDPRFAQIRRLFRLPG
jgi:tetratricopeptide (TPR) repeat protein